MFVIFKHYRSSLFSFHVCYLSPFPLSHYIPESWRQETQTQSPPPSQTCLFLVRCMCLYLSPLSPFFLDTRILARNACLSFTFSNIPESWRQETQTQFHLIVMYVIHTFLFFHFSRHILESWTPPPRPPSWTCCFLCDVSLSFSFTTFSIFLLHHYRFTTFSIFLLHHLSRTQLESSSTSLFPSHHRLLCFHLIGAPMPSVSFPHFHFSHHIPESWKATQTQSPPPPSSTCLFPFHTHVSCL